MKFLLRFLLCISFSFGYCQAIVINKNNKTVATEVKFGSEDKNPKADCRDIIKGDTITIAVSKVGIEGYNFNLTILNSKIVPKIYKWTDYDMFDGKSYIELVIANCKMELNKAAYIVGDTIRGNFTIKTVANKYQKKMTIKGDIFHIIGGNNFVWDRRKSKHNKVYKNGKFVY